jgi:choline monooxygenase
VFLSQGALPHLLTPKHYWCPERFEQEKQLLLRSWHLVGSTVALSSPGDFITFNLLGQAVQVRNFKGTLRALSNVCVHRHCLISNQARGHSSKMTCQYHGWEYASTGRPCKIPSPDSFVPYPKDSMGLAHYGVEIVGQLVFVRLSAEGVSLAEQMGELFPICQERFGTHWQSRLDWQPTYPANWKVAVENSLEAYHVPYIHPNTFGDDPGEERSTHRYHPNGSSFQTSLPFAHSRLDRLFQACEGWVVGQLNRELTDQYWHYHVFPNLLFSFTDTSSFCQCVIPVAPNSCRAVVHQFGLTGKGSVANALAQGWGRLKAQLTKQILNEDRNLFASIQAGLESSQQPGILGRCEERIHRFQSYLLEACPA